MWLYTSSISDEGREYRARGTPWFLPKAQKEKGKVPVEELTNALEKGRENKNEVTNYLFEVCFFKVDTDSGDCETSCLNI